MTPDDAIGVLPELDRGALLGALDRERERDRAFADTAPADPGGEAAGEVTRRREAERAAGVDLDRGRHRPEDRPDPYNPRRCRRTRSRGPSAASACEPSTWPAASP